ncbi:MAG: hypothetical protein ACXADH_00925 [Candidatus Kariarchaeaceae archaeon]|jgi:hypothetical protein
MQRPNKAKQAKDLKRGKKKAAKELKKKRVNKIKSAQRKAENIQNRKLEKETWKMEDEVRRISNKGLTIRKNMLQSSSDEN